MLGIRREMSQQLIINFHGIGDPHNNVEAGERPYWIDAGDMRRIFKRVAELPKRVDPTKDGLPEILITFDDGNLSDLTLALPELVKNNLKATFFVCVGRMNDPHYLNKAGILELLKAGMTIGNHGMYQRNLTTLSERELEFEIDEAGKRLSDVTGNSISEVAIPYGAYNRRVLNWLQAKPLTGIFTSDRGFTSNEQRIKSRESITNAMSKMPMPDMLLKPRSLSKNLRDAVVGAYKRWR
jgi:peptidoglycan/xylan/chitin deacetylase (PgdA/CDA1 family)